MEKSTIVAIFLFVCLPFFSETSTYQSRPSNSVFTIVIDPGHGGKDSGALGSVVKEKDIALKLALRLGQYVQQYMPGVRVLYTRTTDSFIPLHQRIAIANNNHADLFFSIHCNSMLHRTNTVAGTETYVMGLHRVEENLNVAKRENKAVLLEKDYAQNYGGYDPHSSEGHIMLSMYQNAYLSQSLLLAEKVEQQFIHTAKRKSRGVKQAGFLVLRAATMPSVLVETGFLSNTIEESYLNSEKGQVYTASAMYRALKEYKYAVEQATNYNYRMVKGRSTTKTQPTYSTTALAKKHYYQKTPEKHQFVRKTVVPDSKPLVNEAIFDAPRQSFNEEPPVKEMPSITEMYPTSLQPIKPRSVYNTNNKTVFRVQLAAVAQKTSVKTGTWAAIEGVECVKVGNSYKLLIGTYIDLNTAAQQQEYWRQNGFKDAFIVAFRNGQRISMAEAIQ
ncbi:N-acetylmuramoyl-L-alanine amidase [Aureispira sp. CCB-E]|uniref:N-acetylmuramoyl-L-alanine amidase family protein n=1 Tax=Aureispira sp. CCB-E TaxID=3051121 RepID=UPI002868E88E|nr:N-acetylmuramoyl-L-alanine amidase [Aureispira sp. CCB-E]WMX16091.1 N-acetylmuramoyl-L-alanine amidase [Aureispira sp. CCB-E]